MDAYVLTVAPEECVTDQAVLAETALSTCGTTQFGHTEVLTHVPVCKQSNA